MAANNFNPIGSAIQFFRQQFHQRFVGCGVHRRRSDVDFQFIALCATNLVFCGARLHFYGEQNTVRLCVKKSGERHVDE